MIILGCRNGKDYRFIQVTINLPKKDDNYFLTFRDKFDDVAQLLSFR